MGKSAKPKSSPTAALRVEPVVKEPEPVTEPVAPESAAKAAVGKTLVEATPSHRGEISALASANAPFLYFDGAPNFGLHNGIVNITLEAIRFSAVDHEIVPDRVIVAHLRMGLTAAQALKSALEKVLLLAAPVPPGQKN